MLEPYRIHCRSNKESAALSVFQSFRESTQVCCAQGRASADLSDCPVLLAALTVDYSPRSIPPTEGHSTQPQAGIAALDYINLVLFVCWDFEERNLRDGFDVPYFMEAPNPRFVTSICRGDPPKFSKASPDGSPLRLIPILRRRFHRIADQFL